MQEGRTIMNVTVKLIQLPIKAKGKDTKIAVQQFNPNSERTIS